MNDKLVMLGVYTTAFEAQMDKNLLETNGITACVAEDQAGSMLGTVGNLLGGVKLLVSEPDATRAQLILASARGEPVEDAAEAEPSSEEIATTRTCPHCGQSFDGELARCPRCAPSEEFFEDDPDRPRANLAPLGPEDELKDAPYSRGDEYASRALAVSLVMLFIAATPILSAFLFARTLFELFGGWSLPMVVVIGCTGFLLEVVPHLYVFYLVFRFFFYEGELRKSSEYKAIAAVLISGSVLGWFVLFVFSART